MGKCAIGGSIVKASNTNNGCDMPAGEKLRLVEVYSKGMNALDIGCGRGWYSELMADLGYEITAIDRSIEVNDERIKTIQMDIQKELPFPDNFFDTVVAFDILEHLDYEEEILNEIERITKKRLLISVPNSDDLFLPIYGLTFSNRRDKSHKREYTFSELVRKLETRGFIVIYIAPFGFVNPNVFSEFVKSKPLRWIAQLSIRLGWRTGIIDRKLLPTDIIAVAEK